MKKLRMNKKGFTLVEIVLVIAIIVIVASAAIFGVVHILNNANKGHDVTALHAGCWYIKHTGTNPNPERYATMTKNGTTYWVEVVPKGTPDAEYYSDWDEMYEQVDNICVVTPVPDTPGYVPGGGAGDPGGGGTPVDLPGGGGTPGGGGGASNPTSMPGMLEDFFDYYGIPHNGTDVEDGFDINDPSLFGGRTYTEAWEDWVSEHSNKPTTSPEPTTPPEPTKAPDPTATPIPSPTEAPSSGAVTVPSTVTSGTGVKKYTNNSDGTTTVTLMLNTHNTGDVKIRKEADGNYSIYCVGQDGHTVVGNVISYTQDNQWCKENTWIKLTPSDWNKLSSTYGFH